MSSAQAVRRWRATNESATSFASRIPTITKPSGDGVLEIMTGATKQIPKAAKLWFLLLGSDNDVASFRFIGWHQVLLDGSVTLWFPTLILEVVCTASTVVGVAGAAVLNTERFADTITPVATLVEEYVIGAGTVGGSELLILSPANNTPGHVILPLRGFELYEYSSDETTGTPSANVLYSFLDGD